MASSRFRAADFDFWGSVWASLTGSRAVRSGWRGGGGFPCTHRELKGILREFQADRTICRMASELLSRITVEPGKRSGKPCIRGLRITVSDVLEYLASGMTEAEIIADFPELTSEDIRACLAFAAERERRLLGSVA
jgi:uncharacterized protein (DUF433 family)